MGLAGRVKMSIAYGVQKSGRERVVILVKALPHVGQKHGETVCCAGVTLDGEWRRQYPIHFRRLKDGFSRWQWIEYDWIAPGSDDRRKESRRVQEDTIKTLEIMPERDRANFLNPIIMNSTDEAASKGMTLALVQPKNVKFTYKKKTADQLDKERAAYQEAARQKSLFDADLNALEPCPYAFYFDWTDQDGKSHKATCDDWETAATFYRRRMNKGESEALISMNYTFGEEYPKKGMAFAMGTHSRRPEQWLLVGLIRLDQTAQLSLL